jgi:hypothetical protein
VLFGYDKKQILPCVNHYNLQSRGLILHILQERVYHFGPFNTLNYTMPDWPIESVDETAKYEGENLIGVYLDDKQKISMATDLALRSDEKYLKQCLDIPFEFEKYHYTMKEVEEELRLFAVRSKLTGDLLAKNDVELIAKELNVKML